MQQIPIDHNKIRQQVAAINARFQRLKPEFELRYYEKASGGRSIFAFKKVVRYGLNYLGEETKSKIKYVYHQCRTEAEVIEELRRIYQ